jgi:hypothetical protein
MPKLGVGLNLSVPKIGAAAPSGIPVASTSSITISGNGQYSGTYERVGQGGIILNTYSTIENDGFDKYAVNGGYVYRKPLNQNIASFTYNGVLLIPPGVTIRGIAGSNEPNVDQFNGPFDTWVLMNPYYDESWGVSQTFAVNASTNASIIPTSGWEDRAGLVGTPTITAA